MKKQFYTLSTILVMSFSAQAQVGIGTATPNPSSMLDVASTTKGFLMPRMTTTQRTAILSPTGGLQVYDTITKTIWYHDGTVWVNSGINAVEPWFNQATGIGATSNTQNIYQMGNVGIGITTPAQKLDVSGAALLRGGGDAGSITGTQLLLGYGGQSNYQHAIKTRHDANATATIGNAIDFYIWTPVDAPSAQPTRNVMTINGQGNVGIGTSTPLTHLHVNGPAGGGGGAAQVTLSNSLPSAVNTSYHLGRIGFTAFDGSTTSSGPSAPAIIGAVPTEGWSASSHGAALYFYTTLNASIAPTERMRIDNNGYVGIGTSTPSTMLHVNGVITATKIQGPSDSRFKKNIKPIENALEKVVKLGGYTYDWKDASEFPNQTLGKGHDMGVIAQEVEKQFPEAVTTNPDGYKAVSYTELVPALIEAIKTQQTQIDDLKKEVAKLKEQHN